jgi:hypothetical protein
MLIRLGPAVSGIILAVTVLSNSAHAGDEAACAAAGAEAEHRVQLPPGLLLAIGRVESGRRDPASGRIIAWPWTINAGGVGQSFDDRASAAAMTQSLLAKGVASIDVGCFQINLAAHPDAFRTLADAFDPPSNAEYAAQFLMALRGRTGSWEGAVAAYHSATPEIGIPYRDLVLAAWGQALPPGDSAAPRRAEPAGLRTMAWSPVPGGVHVWTPNGGGGANVISFPGITTLPVIHSPQS